MAGTLRRFLFQATEGFYEEQSYTDWAKFEKLTMQPVSAGDTVIDLAGGRASGGPTTPVSNDELVTKSYVDAIAQGLQIKDVCEAVSTSPISSPPTGLPLVDGVYLYDGDRVLLTAQANGVENGIWVAHGVHAFKDLATVSTNVNTVVEALLGGTGGNAITIATVNDGAGAGNFTRVGNAFTFHYATGVTTVANFEAAIAALAGADKLIDVKTPGTGANVFTSPADTFAATNLAAGASSIMTRPTDFAAGMHAHGAFTLIIEGSSWKGSGWVCTNLAAGPDTIGTHALTWAQFSAVQNVTASHGIKLVGSDIQAEPGNGITTTLVGNQYLEVNLTANAGLQFTGASPNGTLGAKANGAAGIAIDGSGIAVMLEGTNPCLEFGSGGDAGKLGALVQAAGGIKKTSTGLAIKQNTLDTGLTIDSNGVLVNSAPKVAENMTVSSGVLAAHCVYISGNDTVATANYSADATSRVIGIAPTAIPSGAGLIVHHGICQTVLAGAGVANTPYYLGSSGELVVAASVGAAKRMICVGYAVNVNDLFVDIKDYGKKAA